jgi:hypothetical protein
MQLLFAHTLHPHLFQNNFKFEHGQKQTFNQKIPNPNTQLDCMRCRVIMGLGFTHIDIAQVDI